MCDCVVHSLRSVYTLCAVTEKVSKDFSLYEYPHNRDHVLPVLLFSLNRGLSKLIDKLYIFKRLCHFIITCNTALTITISRIKIQLFQGTT